MSTMKAIVINDFVKNYDEIKVSEAPKPQPKDGEVLVKVAAAGVNFVDLLYARGKHQNNSSLVRPPFTLGLEFSGTVISSPNSSSFKPGDRVYGGGYGAYTEFISAPSSSLHHIPGSWSFKDAAGLAYTAPVSYGALIVRGALKKGETVLIHAAAGGLGSMAVQIAKAVGARVIATAGSPEKVAVAQRFGADESINYSDPEWYKEVLSLTDGKGVDVVYDSVGLVDKSLKCLKQMGRILLVGFAGREDDMERIAMNRVLLRQAKLIGYRFGATDRVGPEETQVVLAGLKKLMDSGAIKPTVYETEYRGLESVLLALKDLAARKVWGKAVILLDDREQKSRL